MNTSTDGSDPPSPDANQVNELREIASTLVTGAGKLTIDMRKDPSLAMTTKSSGSDLVTAADHAAEKHIVDGLRRLRPKDGLEGEEGTNQAGSSGVVWHIDPIDGTTNYVYGLPYCVSIGATFQQDPNHNDPLKRTLIAGAVFDPTSSELFDAAVGQGATRNGSAITTTGNSELATALIGTGFSYDPIRRPIQAAALSQFIGSVRDVRRLGAAALDLCAVACGRLDGYFEEGLKFWDMAAGIVIAREAGATITDLNGGRPSSTSLIASTPRLYSDLTATLNMAVKTP